MLHFSNLSANFQFWVNHSFNCGGYVNPNPHGGECREEASAPCGNTHRPFKRYLLQCVAVSRDVSADTQHVTLACCLTHQDQQCHAIRTLMTSLRHHKLSLGFLCPIHCKAILKDKKVEKHNYSPIFNNHRTQSSFISSHN